MSLQASQCIPVLHHVCQICHTERFGPMHLTVHLINDLVLCVAKYLPMHNIHCQIRRTILSRDHMSEC